MSVYRMGTIGPDPGAQKAVKAIKSFFWGKAEPGVSDEIKRRVRRNVWPIVLVSVGAGVVGTFAIMSLAARKGR